MTSGVTSGLEPSFFTWLSKIAKNSYLLSPLEMLLAILDRLFFKINSNNLVILLSKSISNKVI